MIRRDVPSAAIRCADLQLAISIVHSSRRTDPRRLPVSNEMCPIIASKGMNLEVNIIEIEEKSTSKSKRLVTKVLEDESIVVVDGHKRYIVGASKRQCGYPACWSVPCPHLILVHHKF
jgi:hypothetical protein